MFNILKYIKKLNILQVILMRIKKSITAPNLYSTIKGGLYERNAQTGNQEKN